jgi:hypothetical protein
VFVQVARKDGKAAVTLDAVKADGKYLNDAPAELTVIDPQGGEQKVAMTQTAPGRYSGEFPADKSGTYHVQTAQQPKGQPATQQSRGLVVNYDDELRLKPTDEALLRGVAAASGGVYKPARRTCSPPTSGRRPARGRCGRTCSWRPG